MAAQLCHQLCMSRRPRCLASCPVQEASRGLVRPDPLVDFCLLALPGNLSFQAFTSVSEPLKDQDLVNVALDLLKYAAEFLTKQAIYTLTQLCFTVIFVLFLLHSPVQRDLSPITQGVFESFEFYLKLDADIATDGDYILAGTASRSPSVSSVPPPAFFHCGSRPGVQRPEVHRPWSRRFWRPLLRDAKALLELLGRSTSRSSS